MTLQYEKRHPECAEKLKPKNALRNKLVRLDVCLGERGLEAGEGMIEDLHSLRIPKTYS